MQEEIFGPILPILTYDSLEEVTGQITENQSRLPYITSESRKKISRRSCLPFHSVADALMTPFITLSTPTSHSEGWRKWNRQLSWTSKF